MLVFQCIDCICDRQRAAGSRTRGSEASKRPGARERPSRGVGVPDANAELASNLIVSIIVFSQIHLEYLASSFSSLSTSIQNILWQYTHSVCF